MANSFNLSTTDQSIQNNLKAPTDVKASREYDKTVDPKTGEEKDKQVSKDGVNIDKSKSPYLELGGPLGHMYTELLNKVLATNESMASVVSAAGEAAEAAEDTTNIPTGFVAIHDGGVRSEVTGDVRGYLHVVDAAMNRTEMMDTLSAISTRKIQNPDQPIGLAIVGDMTPTSESLISHVGRMGVPMAISQSAALTLAMRLWKK